MSKWQWINDELLRRGISQAEFAKRVDWQQARVSELISDKRDIPGTKLYNIAKFLGVDLGKLTAYNSGKNSDIPLPAHMAGVNALSESLSSFFSPNPAATVSIDIISATACCGTGIENFAENTTGQWIISAEDFRAISLSSQPENIKMLKVRGDSMEPTLKDGDWVLADISRRTPESDGMYLLRLSTGLAVKRLQGSVSPDTITVKSDNPKYDAENAKLSDIAILGRIVYTLKSEKVG